MNINYKNQMKTTGIALLIIGLGLTLFTAVTFFTKEKIVDIGSVEITANKPNYLSWSPAVGLVVMGLGGIILWKASSKRN
jgi:ABC-type uncharacterized transport system permease subunit